MLNNIKKRNEGFTIIEVLIVLAIAGLILLVVFLAVPALQRNSRNTQRKTDASNLLSAVNEFTSNNSGALPAAQATLGSAGSTTATLGSGTGVNTVPTKLGYYTAENIAVVDYASGLTTTKETVKIVRGATCNGNALASGSSRSVAIIYTAEENAALCLAS